MENIEGIRWIIDIFSQLGPQGLTTFIYLFTLQYSLFIERFALFGPSRWVGNCLLELLTVQEIRSISTLLYPETWLYGNRAWGTKVGSVTMKGTSIIHTDKKVSFIVANRSQLRLHPCFYFFMGVNLPFLQLVKVAYFNLSYSCHCSRGSHGRKRRIDITA